MRFARSLYIGDLNEFNVLKGEYGYHVIDADCRLNVPELECGGTYVVTAPVIDFSRPFVDWKTSAYSKDRSFPY